METSEIIATIPKNANEQIRVTLSEYKGRVLLGMRVWWHSLESEEWHPSKKGFSCSPERLPELAAALKEAERRARKKGLLTDEGRTPDA
jgi:hypothetical protein